MNYVIRKLRAIYNISRQLWDCRKVVTGPLRCARLFMERTPDSYVTELRFGSLRYLARKEDMSAVREVLVGGGYDFLFPYLKGLSEKPVILDCGANIGSFGLRVLKERPDARIVSVEAAADTFALLAGNQRRNPGNWSCVHAALWKADGHLTLTRNAASVMHSVREDGGNAGEQVPARTLRSIMEEYGMDRLHVLKMDIEGAETAVIPAALDELKADVMIVELHKNVSDPTECVEILAGKYPYAFVSRDQLRSESFPNVVYYLSKRQISAPGMVEVKLPEHLKSVYVPERWRQER